MRPKKASPFEKAAVFEESAAVFPEKAAVFSPKGAVSFGLTRRLLVRGSGARIMTVALRDHPDAKRIASPAVRAKMLAVCGKQLRGTDCDDVIQKSYMRLLTLLDELPETEERLLGLVVVIVRGQIVSHFRRGDVEQARHASEDAPPVASAEEADASMAERVEWQRLYEWAREKEARGEIDADCIRWAARLTQGDDYATIAADEGLTEGAVRKRMARFRKLMREHWKEATGLGGAVLALLIFLFARHKEPAIEATHDRYVAPSATASAVAVETPQQKAASLREAAKGSCDVGDTVTCEKLLDEAKELDPFGEEQHEVIELRHFIANVKQHGLK